MSNHRPRPSNADPEEGGRSALEVQFGDAMPLGDNCWRLRRLLRGRRGTQAQDHAVGTRFVMIERDTLVVVPLPRARTGGVMHVVADGIGDATPVAASASLSGISIAPPSPVSLEVRRTGDGGAALTWVRRSRAGWRWQDGADAPLVEETERYRVAWEGGDGSGEVVVDTPAVDLPPALFEAGPLIVSVRQLGTLAASAAATITI